MATWMSNVSLSVSLLAHPSIYSILGKSAIIQKKIEFFQYFGQWANIVNITIVVLDWPQAISLEEFLFPFSFHGKPLLCFSDIRISANKLSKRNLDVFDKGHYWETFNLIVEPGNIYIPFPKVTLLQQRKFSCSSGELGQKKTQKMADFLQYKAVHFVLTS